MSPKLSICIPTRDRARYLERLLSHLASDCRFSFATEVIVCDNASSDETPMVIEKFGPRFPMFTALRQSRAVEGERNARAAMRAASGAYLMYVADDDFLLPDAVPALIEILDSSPTLNAVFAPWDVYDVAEEKSLGQFYAHAEPRTFRMSNALDALEFMLDAHVFPEIGVYRTAAFAPVLFPAHFTYWAFTNLIGLMARGSVQFHPRPFYRSVVRQEGGQRLNQVGHMQARTAWDTYRGGLEYYLHHALGLSGSTPSQERRQQLNVKIDAFIKQRMEVAMRLWSEAGEALRAYELLVRLRVGGALTAQQDAMWTDRLRMRAAVQAATLALQDIPGLGSVRLVLAGIAEPAAFRHFVAEMRDPPAVEEFDLAAGVKLSSPDKCICIRGQSVAAAELVKLGVPPGRIISEGDLLLTCL